MAGTPTTTFEIASAAFASLQTYATQNNNAALSAISALSGMMFPAPGTKDITYEQYEIVDAEDANLPEDSPDIGTAPDIPDIDVPDKPDKLELDKPELGDLLDIVIPDPPEIDFPVLDIDKPVYSIPTPLPWAFSVGDILITDDPMIQAAMTRLKNNIAYGGTGLTSAVEDAIWNRDLERNEQQLSDSTDKITSMWAKKGFSLPDGLLANSLSELQITYMNKRIDRSREIAVKQSELEQSNLFKSLELSIKLASDLIGMLIQYEELVFKGQEATAKFANEYIDLQIKTYASLVEAYKASAQVYESKVRANLAKVEIFKVQIEGQVAIGQVNEQTIKVFSEQIKATIAQVEAYTAEVGAMTALLGVEKAKVEANKLQMDAWATQANVKIAVYNGAIEVYKAKSQQNISVAEVESKQIEASVRAHLQATELAVKTFEIEEKNTQAAAALQLEAAKAVAQSASTLAAGALAAMSAHASIGFNSSYQDTHYTDETPK